MNINEVVVPVRTGCRGTVPEGAEELAVSRIRSVLRHVARPVLSARVTLTMSADPAVAFPATAHATIDVNGRIVRAAGAGQTMGEAIGRMADRLRARLDRAVHARRSLASRRLPVQDASYRKLLRRRTSLRRGTSVPASQWDRRAGIRGLPPLPGSAQARDHGLQAGPSGPRQIHVPDREGRRR